MANGAAKAVCTHCGKEWIPQPMEPLFFAGFARVCEECRDERGFNNWDPSAITRERASETCGARGYGSVTCPFLSAAGGMFTCTLGSKIGARTSHDAVRFGSNGKNWCFGPPNFVLAPRQ